jgi:hypothetical protein
MAAGVGNSFDDQRSLLGDAMALQAQGFEQGMAVGHCYCE